MMNYKEEGYTCDGSIKGVKGIEKPKYILLRELESAAGEA